MCGRSQFLSVPEVVECFAPARAGDVAGVVNEAFPGSVVPGLVAHGGERLYRLGAPGPSRRRATMLTRPSDPVVTPFHDRMPVILTSDLVDPWLAGDPVSLEGLLADSPPLAAEPMAPVQAPGPEQQSLL